MKSKNRIFHHINSYVKLILILISIIILPIIYMRLISPWYISYINPKFSLTRNLSYSSRGNYLAASTFDEVFLWNSKNEDSIIKHPGNAYNSNCAISLDEKYFGCLTGSCFSLFDINSKQSIYSKEYSYSYCSHNYIDFSPDSKFAIIFEENRDYYFLFDIDKKNLTEKPLDKKTTILMSLRESVDNNWLVGAIHLKNKEGQYYLNISLIDYTTNEIRNEFQVPLLSNNIPKILTGGSKLFICEEKIVNILDIATSEMKNINFTGTSDIYGVSMDGKIIAKLFDNKHEDEIYLRIYRVENREMISEIPLVWYGRGVHYLALNPVSDRIAVGFQRAPGGREGKIVIYDILSKNNILTMKMR